MTKQITKQEINKLDKHLQGLEDNWLSDECRYTAENDDERYEKENYIGFESYEDIENYPSSKLPNGNYKDLRVLRDIINKLKGEK